MPATIRRGSSGPDVIQWQQIIGVAADGKFGPATEAATKSYQKSNGLTADGIVGPKTWEKALSTFAPTATPKPSFAPVAPPPPTFAPSPGTSQQTIRRGSIGPTVVQWQKIIGVTADGNFGPATETATKAWQKARGLVADGIVGPKSWAAASSSAPPPARPVASKTVAAKASPRVVIPPVKPTTPAAAAFVPQAGKPPTFAPSPGTKPVPGKKAAARPATPVADTPEVQAASTMAIPGISKWPGWAQILAAVSAVAGIFFVGKRMKKIG